jgi:hypothetical protein
MVLPFGALLHTIFFNIPWHQNFRSFMERENIIVNDGCTNLPEHACVRFNLAIDG